MGICPNCGDWVDDGDICMSCGGSGNAGGEYDDFGGYGSSYSSSYSEESIQKSNENHLKFKKRCYESSIESARNEDDVRYKLKHYRKAIDDADDYHAASERYGMELDGMPDREHPLSDADVSVLSQLHYKNLTKLSLFGNDDLKEIEDILKRSGNVDVIRHNESILRERRKESARRYNIQCAIDLRRSYFEHIEKANLAVEENKIKKAMKEYRRADSSWREYFDYYYKNDPRMDKMPEEKFSKDTVDHMMVIYVQTHPLLTSKRKLLKINWEIVEFLDDRWDESLLEADRKAQEIYAERQMRIKKMEKKAAEVIAGARIAGEKIFGLLKR